MLISKFKYNPFSILISVMILYSCNGTKFTGDFKTIIVKEDKNKILVIDYTSYYNKMLRTDLFRYISGEGLAFQDIYCSQQKIWDISRKCIIEMSNKFNTEYIIVCRNSYLKSGDILDYVTHYEVEVHYDQMVSQNEDTDHEGKVLFDIYCTEDGKKIASFRVVSNVSGIKIRNRRNSGFTTINLKPSNSAIIKARKAGLLNIANRIR